MGDNGTEIEKHPQTRIHAFHVPKPDPFLFQSVHNMLGNGPYMTVGISMGNEKIGSNIGELSKIQNDGILGFFVFGGF